MQDLGRWITNNTQNPFYLKKIINISKEISTSTAYVCGLGQFNFYINGSKVEDHILDPGWTYYDKLIQYVTFDLTNLLKIGTNVISAEVGNGWYIMNKDHYTFKFPDFMPPNPNPYHPFGKCLAFALKIIIQYKDGTTENITADDTFKVRPHMVCASNVYGSEFIDGRFRNDDWKTINFSSDKWSNASIIPKEEEPKGKLINQFQSPVRVIHTYEGKEIHTVNQRKIFDLGQNVSAILELEVKGKPGDKVLIYPAEKLDDKGDVDQVAKNWNLIDNVITYVIGKDNEWENCQQTFTYFAGRFLGIETTCSIRNVKAHAITSATKVNGHFKCDNESYNKIYDMIEKTVEANMLSVHTDCPTIERFAWQEPNHLMAPSIMFMKDVKSLWDKFLLDMRVAQHTADDVFFDMQGKQFHPGDGLMPSQAPCYIPNVLPVPGLGSFYDIIPWGSTCILGTYWSYRFYNDRKVIEDNYEAGMKYLKYLKTKINENGFINHGLGDWGNPRNELVRENIETAFLFADAKILSKFASILNKREDEEELISFAQKIKDNYNDKLLVQHENGFFCYKAFDHPKEVFLTQAAQALPLYWGMVPSGKEEDISKALKFTLERDGSFICGEIGLPYVIQCARLYGMNDLIARFIMKKEHPSYYAFILDGETTLGEYWEKNPRSHCHDMMGHIIEWFYNGIAGINPSEEGFKKITIKPFMPNDMNEFKCNYDSIYGKIEVNAKRVGDNIQLDVNVPKEIEFNIDKSNLNH